MRVPCAGGTLLRVQVGWFEVGDYQLMGTCIAHPADGATASRRVRILPWPILSMALPVVLLSVVTMIASAVALRRTWRGRRVGDHPHCAACDFDLRAALPTRQFAVSVAPTLPNLKLA